jgi:hypothetical protein
VWGVLEILADHPLVNLGHIGQVMIDEKKHIIKGYISFLLAGIFIGCN